MRKIDPTVPSYNNYDPLRDTNLINPIDVRGISSDDARILYHREDLSIPELLVLDYFGTTTIVKSGEVTISFQGLKRLISLHQARLTKAITRLVDKDLLIKVDVGYTLTNNGKDVFERLFYEFRKSNEILPSRLYSHVSHGLVQGPSINDREFQLIAEKLIGRWFGKFRFTTKTDYGESFELGWISTDGQISASLVIGPQNRLRLSISAPIYSESETEIQLLINHISQSIEEAIDAPVIFSAYQIYENRKELTTELDDAIRFAG